MRASRQEAVPRTPRRREAARTFVVVGRRWAGDALPIPTPRARVNPMSGRYRKFWADSEAIGTTRVEAGRKLAIEKASGTAILSRLSHSTTTAGVEARGTGSDRATPW